MHITEPEQDLAYSKDSMHVNHYIIGIIIIFLKRHLQRGVFWPKKPKFRNQTAWVQILFATCLRCHLE